MISQEIVVEHLATRIISAMFKSSQALEALSFFSANCTTIESEPPTEPRSVEFEDYVEGNKR